MHLLQEVYLPGFILLLVVLKLCYNQGIIFRRWHLFQKTE